MESSTTPAYTERVAFTAYFRASVTVQLAFSLWLLHREFALKLPVLATLGAAEEAAET